MPRISNITKSKNIVVSRYFPSTFSGSRVVTDRYDELVCREVYEGDPNFRWCTNRFCSTGQIVENGGIHFSRMQIDAKFQMPPYISLVQHANSYLAFNVVHLLIRISLVRRIWFASAISISQPTNSLDSGSKRTRNPAFAVVGFKKWTDVTMLNALQDQLDVGKNGVGCAGQNMVRSGELGIQLIKLIVLIGHEKAIQSIELRFWCLSSLTKIPLGSSD